MFFWANPYHVTQAVLTFFGGAAVLAAVAVLAYDHLPWNTNAHRIARETKLLLGSWRIKSAVDPDYSAIWTFNPDGTVVSEVKNPPRTDHGAWRFEKAHVPITWNRAADCWDNFDRPIEATVHGDNWTKRYRCVRGSKVNTPQQI
jgi:hypothetical protein